MAWSGKPRCSNPQPEVAKDETPVSSPTIATKSRVLHSVVQRDCTLGCLARFTESTLEKDGQSIRTERSDHVRDRTERPRSPDPRRTNASPRSKSVDVYAASPSQ